MNTVFTAVIVLGAVASLAFLAVYMPSARWWQNRPGRALIALGVELAMILTFSAVRRLTTTPAQLHGSALVAGLIIYGSLDLTEIYLAFAFWREIRERRLLARAQRRVGEGDQR